MAQDDPRDREGGDGTRAGDMPKVDWDKIKHAYIHGDWSLGRIADAPTWATLAEAEAIAEDARRRAPGELGQTVEVIDDSCGMRPAYAIGTAHPAARDLEFGYLASARDALALAGFSRPFNWR